MTCTQLGGACDLKFQAETFDEIAEQSKMHGMEMFMKQDPDHMEAINKMAGLMQDKEAMAKWMDEKRAEFDAL